MESEAFESLCKMVSFGSDSEKSELAEWCGRKGVFLFIQAASLLTAYVGEKPTCAEACSLIRYDKNVRDLLYKYLATAEESMRGRLCNGFDIEGKKLWTKKKNAGKNVLVPQKGSKSALYYEISRRHADLSDIISLTEIAGLPFDAGKAEEVRKLRNYTMHHSMLCLGEAKTKAELNERISELRAEVSALYFLLPDAYRQGFEKDLNKLLIIKENSHFTRINLGVMKDGIFR